jgi:hypothetical protein
MFLLNKEKAAAAICGDLSEKVEHEEKEEIGDLDGALDQIGGELMNAINTKDGRALSLIHI